MTRITNADHVLLLLRDHLERTQKTRRKRPSATTESKARPTALERASQLAASGALSDEDIERTIVAGLLSEALGDGVANDAKFQQLVADVVGVLNRDEQAKQLLKQAAQQIVGNGA